MGKGVVKLGEGNWAVKDGNLLAAKETNGRFKNAEFTVTRGTDATYVGKDGLIKTASFYNILPYSEDFSQSAWQKSNITLTPNSITSPDGILNAYKLTKPTSSQPRLFELSVYPTTGVHTFTSFYKNLDGDSVLIRLDAGNNTANCNVDLTTNTLVNSGANIISSNITQLSDGWIRVSVTANILSTSWVLDAANLFDLSVDSSVYIWGAQLVEGTEALDYQYTNGKEGIPRIDFTDNTDGHLLLEPESRNLIPYSEDFSEWSNVYTILTPNQSSPDGSNNAFIIEDENATAYRKVDETITTNATPHTFSVFIKKKTSAVSSYSGIQMGTGFSYVVFDSFNGTYYEHDNTNYDNVEVQDFNSNWWRLKLTATVTTSTRVALWGAISTSATNINNGATGSETFYGAQLEELPYATSYIPTSGSTVTRDAEICTGAGEAADFNSEEGVLYAEIAKAQDDNDNFIVMSLNNDASNSDANSVTIGFDNGQDFYFRVKSPSGTYINATISANENQFYKVALKYKSGDIAVWIDGVEVLTSTDTYTFAVDLDNLSFDLNGNGTLPFYGKVKGIKVYKEALSDTDLQNLTS